MSERADTKCQRERERGEGGRQGERADTKCLTRERERERKSCL